MNDTNQRALQSATQKMLAAGIESAANDARHLLAYALDIKTERLMLVLPDVITTIDQGKFDTAIKARLDRQPVSHILGRRSFWGRDLKVTPSVLDPRPETECLIEAALAHPFTNVLDLGTGSGCILLTLLAENPSATGLGVDISKAALEIAVENRAMLGLDQAAKFQQSDWFSGVSGQFDLIVSNPPYIAKSEFAALAPEVRLWEPSGALTPGVSGLEAYKSIAQDIAEFLAPNGRVLLEIGPTQAGDVGLLFRSAGFEITAVHPDLDGRDRVVEAQYNA